MPHYIYSTSTCDTRFVEYIPPIDKHDTSAPRVARAAIIKGGHGVANRNVITPCGVVTRIDSDEELAWLEALPAFQDAVKHGFMRVEKKKAEDSETVVQRDMNPADGSAPLTPKRYKKGENGENSYKLKSAAPL